MIWALILILVAVVYTIGLRLAGFDLGIALRHQEMKWDALAGVLIVLIRLVGFAMYAR